MVSRKKIDLNKVLNSLNTTCPYAGIRLPPQSDGED